MQVGLKQFVQDCMVQDCSGGKCQWPVYDGGVEGDKLLRSLIASQEE